jgi:hypothetical protein
MISPYCNMTSGYAKKLLGHHSSSYVHDDKNSSIIDLFLGSIRYSKTYTELRS